ncbi:MAG: NAD(P)H-dependent glycerol-3-phosphate dehydrogenase [Acidobacteriota bacterium]
MSVASGSGAVAPSWRIAVLGAGSWGTALAVHAAGIGHEVRLWARRADAAAAMRDARENRDYLPGVELPSALAIDADAATCMSGADLVLSVVPSRWLREVWQQIGADFPAGAHLMSATKGLEDGTFLRMSEVLGEYTAGRRASLAALSGPSFAAELATGHPTAVTLGCRDLAAAETVQTALSGGALRVYRNADIIGVEYGGALKNVIAIATGIGDGLGLGTNSRAALITRGLKELGGLAMARGADATTLMGLAGLGDLVLTCTGPLSRNRHVGIELGRGRKLQDIIASMQMVAEGVETTAAAYHLGRQTGVPMPITDEVNAILHEGKDPRAAIEDLMTRALVEE